MTKDDEAKKPAATQDDTGELTAHDDQQSAVVDHQHYGAVEAEAVVGASAEKQATTTEMDDCQSDVCMTSGVKQQVGENESANNDKKVVDETSDGLPAGHDNNLSTNDAAQATSGQLSSSANTPRNDLEAAADNEAIVKTYQSSNNQQKPHHQKRKQQQQQQLQHQHQMQLAASSVGDQVPISADYLAQLIKDKKQLSAFPSVFIHVQRLIDDEINKVRQSLLQLSDVVHQQEPLELPEPEGEFVQLQEKIYVPVGEHPEYNFVGRLLGPRGMTAKQLEQETGCKIMIRGRGSMRDKKKEEQNRGKANWEHLNDELHVLITVEDTLNRAQVKLSRALEEVRQLLVPIVDGEDELKKRQLMELAIINGTYRDCNYNEALSKMLNDAVYRQAMVDQNSNNGLNQQQLVAASTNGKHQSLTSATTTGATNPHQRHPSYLVGPTINGSSISSGVPSTGSNTPNSVHSHNQHAHHQLNVAAAAAAAAAAAIANRQQPQQHHQQVHHATGIPPTPPPPPPAIQPNHHLTHPHPHHHPHPHQQSPAVAAAAAAAALIANPGPDTSAQLMYAQQQYHDFHHFAAMAAAAAASQPILAPDAYAHHPHHPQSAAAAAAVAQAVAAATAANHHQIQQQHHHYQQQVDHQSDLHQQHHHHHQQAAAAAAAAAIAYHHHQQQQQQHVQQQLHHQQDGGIDKTETENGNDPSDNQSQNELESANACLPHQPHQLVQNVIIDPQYQNANQQQHSTADLCG